MKYSRVTFEVRCQIDAFLQAGFSKSEIARRTGFHKSSISREIRRNFYGSTYSRGTAHEQARRRYRNCRKRYKMNEDLGQLLLTKIKLGWSPEQISGRIKLEQKLSISHECFYQFIRRHKGTYRPFMKKMWRKYVGRIRRNRLIANPHFNKIADRPSIVAERKRKGDWERDILLALRRDPLLVCVERQTRFVKIEKAENLKAKTIAELTTALLTKDKKKVYTITNDRGPEFNENLSITNAKIYYCDPCAPQQRGTIENTIGLLRRYIKNSTDLKSLSSERIREIEDALNMRPRKCLNYRTPYEMYFGLNVALAI